jgi:archaeal cell division control protein 6
LGGYLRTSFCDRAGMRPMTGRAVADILSELDLYSLIRTRVVSKGRYGRTREIILDLPSELVDSIHDTIRMSFDVER